MGRRDRDSQAKVRYHPPARYDLKALEFLFQAVALEMTVAVLRHFDTPTPLGFESAREGAGIGTVGSDQFQAQEFARTGLADYGGKLCKPLIYGSFFNRFSVSVGLHHSSGDQLECLLC